LRLYGTYELSPKHVHILRNHWLKGMAACLLLFGFYLAMVFGTGVRTGEPLSLGLDAMLLIGLLFTLGNYSRGYASLRVKLAREAVAEGDKRQAVALLIPFVGKKARFDPDGEALKLLAQLAKELGEHDLAKVLKDRA
jgi:integrase